MKNTPRTLYRYILWELLISFSLSALVLSLLVAIVFAMKALQGGYTLNIVFPWLYDSILYSLYFTVPMAMMVATTLGYGRFVSDGEFFAATASGIAPSVLLRPLLL
ncbi:MAG TPA: LptF/LptG family permease, partial [Planctomycetes bacterium]|nr:LptF/LptG family permease [Planctomycetota bacterium]